MSGTASMVRRVLFGGAITLLAVGYVAVTTSDEPSPSTPIVAADGSSAERPSVVVHRTAECGCCGGYEDILAAAGWELEQVIHTDLGPVRDRLGVPDTEASCHTLEVGDYVVEGHVPLQALEDLVLQAPPIDGIALAGMPAGSPGMPGPQAAPFEVTALVDGSVVDVFGEY